MVTRGNKYFNNSSQIGSMKENQNTLTAKKSEIMTTTGGNPVADNQNCITAGPRGLPLMQDYQRLEKLAHQNRERIPERTVHAKGSAAYGTLTITHDITKCSKAVSSRPPAQSCRTLTTRPQNLVQPT